MIINNIKKGLIMQQSKKAGARISYTLTRTGEQYVEAGFKTTKAEADASYISITQKRI